jgi:hypothetical protein
VMSAQGVWEFSRSFLGDRDGCVAVIKIFMDETGIHDDAHTVAVAAYISRPKHWRSWTKSWNAAKRPIKVFHATDCASFHGEFEGWNKEQRDQFVAKLLPVIPAHKLAGIVIGIKLEDLTSALKGYPELIEMFGTPYTACFQWAISIIMEIATDRGSGERMAFIHEVNDYKGEALKAFDYVKEFLNPRQILMTMGFGSKADFPRYRPRMCWPMKAASFYGIRLAPQGGHGRRSIPTRRG